MSSAGREVSTAAGAQAPRLQSDVDAADLSATDLWVEMGTIISGNVGNIGDEVVSLLSAATCCQFGPSRRGERREREREVRGLPVCHAQHPAPSTSRPSSSRLAH